MWAAVPGISFVGKTSNHDQIKSYISQGYGVMLNVNSGGHWVLATGVSGSSYLVNDPGFSKTSYGQSEVS